MVVKMLLIMMVATVWWLLVEVVVGDNAGGCSSSEYCIDDDANAGADGGDAVEVMITWFWWRVHLDGLAGGGCGGEPSRSDGNWDGFNGAIVCGCGTDGCCSEDDGDTACGSGSGKMGIVGVLLKSSRVVLFLRVFWKVSDSFVDAPTAYGCGSDFDRGSRAACGGKW